MSAHAPPNRQRHHRPYPHPRPPFVKPGPVPEPRGPYSTGSSPTPTARGPTADRKGGRPPGGRHLAVITSFTSVPSGGSTVLFVSILISDASLRVRFDWMTTSAVTGKIVIRLLARSAP